MQGLGEVRHCLSATLYLSVALLLQHIHTPESAVRLFHSTILVLITLFSIHGPSLASEAEEHANITALVVDAFAQERFADITKLAERYRLEKSRTESGLWKLTVLYGAIDVSIFKASTGRDIAPAYRAIDEKMKRWTTLQPNSPAAHLAYAQSLNAQAWDIRGGGYAYRVKPESWAPFHALIEQARLYLEQNKAVAAVDPHWHEMMLEIARIQSWDDKRFGAAFDAAVAREPLFYQTYFAAVDYLLPKWRGNVEDVELFAQFAAGKTAATEGTGMYARIYWYASQSQFGDDIFQDSLAKWPQMKAGFDDVVARYPDDWNYNNYGKFACLAGDLNKTHELLAKIGNRVLDDAWGKAGLIDKCRKLARSGAL
jgi:hypothetical protein